MGFVGRRRGISVHSSRCRLVSIRSVAWPNAPGLESQVSSVALSLERERSQSTGDRSLPGGRRVEYGCEKIRSGGEVYNRGFLKRSMYRWIFLDYWRDRRVQRESYDTVFFGGIDMTRCKSDMSGWEGNFESGRQ